MFLFTSNILNIGLTVALAIVFFILCKLVSKTINDDEDRIRKGFIWFYVLLFIVLLVFVGLSLWFFNISLIDLLKDMLNWLTSVITESIAAIIGTVITIFVAAIILRVVNMFVKRTIQKEGPNQKRVTTIMKVVKSITKYVIYIVVIIVILASWGVNVLPALAGLGIAGLVLGMGAQSLIKDFISGFFIIFEHHFDVGDIIDVNGFKGEVVDIGLKTTRIKNWKQDINIISNGNISSLTNYSKSDSVAVITFGIGYQEDVQKTIDILNKELPKFREKFPEIKENPSVLGVTELADSSVNITVIVKTETEKHYAVERAVRQGIKAILDENGIEIPFPQMVVHEAK